MIYSMTGFGKATLTHAEGNFKLEIRSLNSKGLELILRLPDELRNLEADIRNLLETSLLRGKVELNIERSQSQDAVLLPLNKPLAKAYLDTFRAWAIEWQLPQDQLLSVVLHIPEIYQPSAIPLSEHLKHELLERLKEVIVEVNKFRLQEGKHLKKDLQKQLALIQHCAEIISPMELERTEKIRARLKDQLRASQLGEDIQENRLEQELIYYLEKLDITEERVRLENHLDYFKQTLDETDHEKGKKLGFICQEMGREINTIGSKANHAGIQHQVVLMKDALEKVKEQLHNIL